MNNEYSITNKKKEMKKETTKQNTTESQIRCSIKDTFAGTRVKLNQLNLKVTATNGDFNIFLNQNLGKGPPGRTRSPVAARGHPPASEARPPENKAGPPVSNSYDYNKVQLINTNTKFNLLQTFNLLIMKKQILFIALFVLAVLANVNKSYGQTCAAGAFTPAPGVAYDYQADVTGTAGATEQLYDWYVTTNVNILSAKMAAGTDFTVAPASATLSAYDVTAVASANTTTAKINLTWTTVALASTNTYYLVVRYSEKNTSGCTVENIKVWQIKPVNSFLLAITGSDATGATIAAPTTCAAGIVSSVVAPNADPTLARVNYTFDKNTLYYKATATGIIGTWRPSIVLPALTAAAPLGQIYTSADWNDKADGTGSWHPFVGAAATSAGGTYASAATDLATVADAVAGAAIVIRVVVDQRNNESLASQTITAGIDGFLPAAWTLSDVTSATDCTPLATVRSADFIILPRPTVAPNAGTFITKAP